MLFDPILTYVLKHVFTNQPKPHILMHKGEWLCSKRVRRNGTMWYAEHPIGRGRTPNAAMADMRARAARG